MPSNSAGEDGVIGQRPGAVRRYWWPRIRAAVDRHGDRTAEISLIVPVSSGVVSAGHQRIDRHNRRTGFDLTSSLFSRITADVAVDVESR